MFFVAAVVWLCLLMAPLLSRPFVWDDLPTVAYNSKIANASFRQLFSPEYFDVAAEFSYRPTSTFLHWAGLKVFGDKPFGHRAVELLLHLAVAGLLVAAFLEWGVAQEAAWLSGAVFLIHPLHLETLMCVAFNEEILVAGFLLGAWWARMRGKTLVSVLCFSLALFAKETALLALPILWLLGRSPSSRLREEGWGRELRGWSPYIIAVAFYCFIRFFLLLGPQEAAAFPTAPPLTMRLYFAGLSLAQFARDVIAPLGLRIEYFAVPPDPALWIAAAIAGWALAIALLWALPLPGMVWAALMFLPTMNLLPAYSLTTRYFAERWTYVPLIGLLLALSARFGPRLGRWLKLASPVFVLALVWLMFWSAREAQPWSDERLLWAKLVEAYPWSAKAHEGLGEAEYRAGDYGPALEEFRQGFRLRMGRQDRVLEYYVPLFEERAHGRPLPLTRETPAVHRWLARAWLAVGNKEQSRGHLERAEQLERLRAAEALGGKRL